jgi:predicted XRE-type DNA-binding protein
MKKSERFKAIDASDVQWPSEEELSKIRDELSSDQIIGSTVLPPSAHPTDKFKYKLCEMILTYRINSGIKQKELAKILGIDEARASEILHYKVDQFTSDRLQEYVQLLYPNVKFDAFAA